MQYTTKNPFKQYSDTYHKYLKNVDYTNKYLNLFLNEDLSLKNSIFFKDIANDPKKVQQLLKKNPDLHLVALAEAPNLRYSPYRIIDLKPHSARSLRSAVKKYDPIVVTSEVYNKLYQNINNFRMSKAPKVIRLMDLATSMYKAGYLGSIGFLVRNFIDSTSKNVIEAGGLSELPRTIKELFTTIKIYMDFDGMEKSYFKFIEDLNAGILPAGYTAKTLPVKLSDMKIYKNNPDMLEFFFDINKGKLPISQEMFELVSEFMMEGPSGGMTKNFQDYLKKISTKAPKKMDSIAKAKTGIYKFTNLPFMPTRHVMNVNERLEKIFRLQLYLTELGHGASKSDAVNKILTTHFDYATKSVAELYAEVLFPFTSFSIKNFEYYADRLLTGKMLVSEVRDILMPILRLDTLTNKDAIDYYDPERQKIYQNKAWLEDGNPAIQLNQARLYHLLNGNIILDTDLDDYEDERRKVFEVLKLNPSIMDAFNMVINPFESIGERLLPMFKYFIDNPIPQDGSGWINYFLDTMPIVSTYRQRTGLGQERDAGAKRNYKRTKDTGWAVPNALLPSMFGTMVDFPDFDPNNIDLNASEDTVKVWFAKYKSQNLPEEYNPYNYYPQYGYQKFDKDAADMEKYGYIRSEAERELGRRYAAMMAWNPQGAGDIYEAFPELNAQVELARIERWGTFNPQDINPNATREMVNFWYSQYKKYDLPYVYNPFRYYPEFQKGTGYSTYKHTGSTPSIANSREFQQTMDYYAPETSYTVGTPRARGRQYRIGTKAAVNWHHRRLYTSTGEFRLKLRLQPPGNISRFKSRMADLRYRVQQRNRHY